jgi:hypothetical protein
MDFYEILVIYKEKNPEFSHVIFIEKFQLLKVTGQF